MYDHETVKCSQRYGCQSKLQVTRLRHKHMDYIIYPISYSAAID